MKQQGIRIYLKSGQTIDLIGPSMTCDNLWKNFKQGEGNSITFNGEDKSVVDGGFIVADAIEAVFPLESVINQ